MPVSTCGPAAVTVEKPEATCVACSSMPFTTLDTTSTDVERGLARLHAD